MEASAPPRPTAIARSPDRLRSSGDAELVRLVRLGHEPAFDEIYDRHHRGILSFSRHMLGSREEGEDAVQHTFIAAFRDLRASDKPIHLKAWLYTIARNRCLSMLRARREQVSIDDVEPSTEGLAAEVQRREDLRDMLRDLHRLPDDQREALVLSELGALSHDEIAMTLDVRKEKVKALVFQARESLTSSRTARNTDCEDIQKQLAILRGGSLRRTTLRRHLDGCPACQAYRAEVHRQRAAIAVILPVAPTAGLKAGVLAGAMSAGAAGAGAAGAGGVAAGGALLGSSGLATKFIVGAALVGMGAGGGTVAIDELRSPPWSSADERPREIRLAGGAGGGYTGAATGSGDSAARPADGSPKLVVASLRERARTVAVQRDTDRRTALGRPVWGKAIGGSRTGPDPALTTISASGGPAGVGPGAPGGETSGSAGTTTGPDDGAGGGGGGDGTTDRDGDGTDVAADDRRGEKRRGRKRGRRGDRRGGRRHGHHKGVGAPGHGVDDSRHTGDQADDDRDRHPRKRHGRDDRSRDQRRDRDKGDDDRRGDGAPSRPDARKESRPKPPRVEKPARPATPPPPDDDDDDGDDRGRFDDDDGRGHDGRGQGGGRGDDGGGGHDDRAVIDYAAATLDVEAPGFGR